MDVKESLLDKKIPNKKYMTPEMTPIERYNVVVDCYNMPSNKVDSIELTKIPQTPYLYTLIYSVSTHLRGKIAFIILCIFPFINIIPFILSLFFAFIFWRSMKIHESNEQKVKDPFKKMTFDPEVCFNMGCDYYFFTIELKQLDGFSLNYQQNVSQRLKLRKERGKTSIMVYNANFWAAYSYFHKWNIYHFSPLAFSTIMLTISNTICILLILN